MLPGHIDPSRPHAVNQLVVADLGIEEVLLAACDDGDVIAHSIRSICHAIREVRDSTSVRLLEPNTLRPLLLTNVGSSAWGLTVHKAARLIAVSSNKHQISVFAFALRGESSLERLSEGDSCPIDILGDVFWEQEKNEPRSPYDRDRNVEIILQGHRHNMPNITFCNTAIDPIGEFLISIDIAGTTLVWNIWQRKVIAAFRPDEQWSGYSKLIVEDPSICLNYVPAKAIRKWLGSGLSGPSYVQFGPVAS